jgi:hypothetical protein
VIPYDHISDATVNRSVSLQCLAEFMVMVRVRVRIAVKVVVSLQCLDAIYSVNRYEEWTPERNAIGHTHGRASSVGTNGLLEQDAGWEPMASSSVNFCRKTRAVHCFRCCPWFPFRMVARGCWLLERDEHRTLLQVLSIGPGRHHAVSGSSPLSPHSQNPPPPHQVGQMRRS